MPRYVRAFVPGGTFFLMVSLLERRRHLLTEQVDLLRRCFGDARRAKLPFVTLADG